MSKKAYCVFGAENYIQKEIVQYLQNTLEEGEAYLRVTGSNRNQGLKKQGRITKILNKEKPKLFKKYVQKSNHIFIDLILNEDKEQDVSSIVNAISTKKQFDDDIHIIVVSNMMSWNQTDPYLYYKEKHFKAYQQYCRQFNMPDIYSQEQDSQLEQSQLISQQDQIEKQDNDLQDDEQGNESNDKKTKNDIQDNVDYEQYEDSQSVIEQRKFIKIDKLYKKFYNQRDCDETLRGIKLLEDQLANLYKINEKVKVYMLYVGLLYGRSQMFLKDYFSKAFMQKSLSVHYNEIIQNYQIPIFNVVNIPQVALKLVERENEQEEQNEQKSIYYGEENKNEQEKDQEEGEQKEEQEQENQNEEKEEQKIPGKLIVEFVTENKMLTHKNIIQTISQQLGNGRLVENIKYKYLENLLNDFNIEQDQKFNDIIKGFKNFQESFQDQIVDYMIQENLNPIKIFFFCLDENQKQFYNKISLIYNIKIIDCENFVNKLYLLEGFKQYYNNFCADDIKNLDILLKQNVQILFDNPTRNRELIIFYIRLLKIRLSLNDCKYKGFILICKNFLVQNIEFQEFFYKNKLSSSLYLKQLKKLKKQEDKQKKIQEKKKQKQIQLAEENYQKLLQQKEEEELNQNQQNKKQIDNSQQSDQDDESQQEEQSQDENEEIKENQQEIDEDEEEEQEEKIEESQEEEDEQQDQEEDFQKTREEFFPDHFILMFKNCNDFQFIEQVQKFCIEKQVKFYIKKLNEKDFQNEERIEQIIYLIRIYLNRNNQNQPKAIGEVDFQKQSEKKLQQYIQKISASKQIIKITNKFNRQSVIKQQNQEFQQAIQYFHKFQTREREKEIFESKNYKNNREILTKIFYDVLYEGLLNIKKLDPSDPFEYLSNFIYEKSFESN